MSGAYGCTTVCVYHTLQVHKGLVAAATYMRLMELIVLECARFSFWVVSLVKQLGF